MQPAYFKITTDMTVENGNIAVTDYSFGAFSEFFKIKLINNPPHSIPAPSAKNCLHPVVIHHLLQIVQPFLICT